MYRLQLLHGLSKVSIQKKSIINDQSAISQPKKYLISSHKLVFWFFVSLWQGKIKVLQYFQYVPRFSALKNLRNPVRTSASILRNSQISCEKINKALVDVV